MRNLLGCALVLGLGLVGCSSSGTDAPVCGDGVLDTGETCDDGNNINGDGCSAGCALETGGEAHISATWKIQTVAGATVGCPSGFDTAALVSQPVNASGAPVGQPITDLFDCAAGQGSSAALQPGSYQSWVEITSHDGSQVYAQSLSAFVDITTVDKTINVAILDNGGYFQLQWNLVRTAGGAPVACSEVDGIGALSTDVSSSTNSADDKFTCEDGVGITGGLTAGTYTVSVDAFADGAGGGALGPATVLTNKVIQNHNRVTDLGTVTVQVD